MPAAVAPPQPSACCCSAAASLAAAASASASLSLPLLLPLLLLLPLPLLLPPLPLFPRLLRLRPLLSRLLLLLRLPPLRRFLVLRGSAERDSRRRSGSLSGCRCSPSCCCLAASACMAFAPLPFCKCCCCCSTSAPLAAAAVVGASSAVHAACCCRSKLTARGSKRSPADSALDCTAAKYCCALPCSGCSSSAASKSSAGPGRSRIGGQTQPQLAQRCIAGAASSRTQQPAVPHRPT